MLKFKVIAKSNAADFEMALEQFVNKGWTLAYFDTGGDSGNKLTGLLVMDTDNATEAKKP